MPSTQPAATVGYNVLPVVFETTFCLLLVVGDVFLLVVVTTLGVGTFDCCVDIGVGLGVGFGVGFGVGAIVGLTVLHTQSQQQSVINNN
jgi:hypothetical protein